MNLRLLAILSILVTTTGCGGASFAGAGSLTAKSSKTKSKTDDAKAEVQPEVDDAVVEREEDTATAKTEAVEEDERIANSTPENPLDVSETGFACLHDMSAANGPWSGTFEGKGKSFVPGMSGILPVSGTVDFAFEFVREEVLAVTDFKIEGGMLGQPFIVSYEPDAELTCGDPSFRPTNVNHAGHVLVVTLTFTHQSWSPPTLKGTWAAKDALMEWASGTWSVARD